ncbi:MAG: YhjD/YihY/BrkB family envelope integrity protein, partial [Verrucomicrobiota bacterium]
MAGKPLSRFRKIKAGVTSVLTEARFFTQGEPEVNWLEKFAHFWVLVMKSFWRNRCPVRASALAYTTLLALVPLLAVGISISTSLLKREGGKQQIEQLINTLVAKVAPQLSLVSKSEPGESGTEKVAESISAYINNVSSGTL